MLIEADRVVWRHEPPMQRLGPEQKASAVVYFRQRVSAQQIERFISEVLEEDAMPRHQGRDYPTFVESYFGLSPKQANGFKACAITFRPGSPIRDKENYLKRIKADPRVAKVFTDTAPTYINSIAPDPK